MSQLKPSEILKEACVKDTHNQWRLGNFGRGVFHYFNYILFHGEDPIELNQVETLFSVKYTIDRQILSNLGGGPVPFKDTSYVCAPNINFLSP